MGKEDQGGKSSPGSTAGGGFILFADKLLVDDRSIRMILVHVGRKFDYSKNEIGGMIVNENEAEV